MSEDKAFVVKHWGLNHGKTTQQTIDIVNTAINMGYDKIELHTHSTELETLRKSIEIATDTLKFCQIHLKSMENYSIVSGALYQIDEALKKLDMVNK